MGAHGRRQLRAALNPIAYLLLFATVLTVLAKYFMTPTSLKTVRPGSNSHPSPSSPSDISKTLVVASTTRDDTTWLSDIPPSLNWTIAHYRVDAPLSPALSVPSTNGNEAMVYLTYIIDHYDALPDVIFFHHSHLQAWHQKLNAIEQLTRLRPSYILKAGYASTRCLSGCENIVKLAGGEP
ncbi:hypothetical protein N0V82_010805, partial [Gnomoniopsis sp. IMI 355080]